MIEFFLFLLRKMYEDNDNDEESIDEDEENRKKSNLQILKINENLEIIDFKITENQEINVTNAS